MSVTTRSPLNKPLAWHIPEMAASIAVHGLLPSLVVRKDKRCKYAIVAERRRLHALQTPVISADETGDCSLCSVYRHHEIGHLIQVLDVRQVERDAVSCKIPDTNEQHTFIGIVVRPAPRST